MIVIRMRRIFHKSDTQNLLMIAFIIFELMAMMFNAFFVKVNFMGRYFMFSYSMIFYCLSFFLVDLMGSFTASHTVERMVSYKIFSQVLFLFLGVSALLIYGLQQSLFAVMLKGAFKACISSMIALYAASKFIDKFTSVITQLVSLSPSLVWRYVLSTLPFEVVYTFTFCFCSFSSDYPLQEVFEIFVLSIGLKVIFAMFFSLVMCVMYKLKGYNVLQQARLP